jgi:serine/threonine-protein kinase
VVALKTLALREPGDDRLQLLFKTEFWAMTRLRHRNLPEVHDFGTLDDGTPYFTMELIGGQELGDSLPLPLHRFYDVFTQLAQALSFIHARRLIHRDVKASNVRLVPEPDGSVRAVLMDFGLVSVAGAGPEAGTVSGTVAYLAPEAIQGAVQDARSDLFSLGVLAVEALTGRLPRRWPPGTAPAAVASSGTHVDLSGLSGFPPGLLRLVRRLVADAPGRRPPSADLVVEDLVGLSGGEDPRALAQKRSYLATSSLVGRDREMGRLRAALDAAREGHGGTLLVAAASGVGKTRLF